MSGMKTEVLDGSRPDPTALVARVAELEARVADLEGELAHLEVALENRTRIGTAIGLLVERHQTTSTLAWTLLTRLSNHTNNKVAEVARLLVAVADGTLGTDDVERVAELARLLPRAAASTGLRGTRPTRPRPLA